MLYSYRLSSPLLLSWSFRGNAYPRRGSGPAAVISGVTPFPPFTLLNLHHAQGTFGIPDDPISTGLCYPTVSDGQRLKQRSALCIGANLVATAQLSVTSVNANAKQGRHRQLISSRRSLESTFRPFGNNIHARKAQTSNDKTITRCKTLPTSQSSTPSICSTVTGGGRSRVSTLPER